MTNGVPEMASMSPTFFPVETSRLSWSQDREGRFGRKASRHGIYRWIFLFRVQKITCFFWEIHGEIKKWWRENIVIVCPWFSHMDLQGFLQWCHRESGVHSFFFSKSPKMTESQWPGKWRNCTATRLRRRRRQSPRRCLFLNGWGAQKRHTTWQGRPHQDEWMIMDEPSSQDILEPLEFS